MEFLPGCGGGWLGSRSYDLTNAQTFTIDFNGATIAFPAFDELIQPSQTVVSVRPNGR